MEIKPGGSLLERYYQTSQEMEQALGGDLYNCNLSSPIPRTSLIDRLETAKQVREDLQAEPELSETIFTFTPPEGGLLARIYQGPIEISSWNIPKRPKSLPTRTERRA
jgi:hypothetical protein